MRLETSDNCGLVDSFAQLLRTVAAGKAPSGISSRVLHRLSPPARLCFICVVQRQQGEGDDGALLRAVAIFVCFGQKDF